MGWDKATFAKAIRARDDFEQQTRETTEKSIAETQAMLEKPWWTAWFAVSPGSRTQAEFSTNLTVERMRINHRTTARIGALKRSRMQGLSDEQRFEMGRYLVGTPDEGNVLTDSMRS